MQGDSHGYWSGSHHNTSHRQGLNAHILAICINKDHVQQIAGKVKHFHTLKHRIVTVCRRQNVGKVLHFVCYHRQPFQQSNGVARADTGIPQFFTDAHILRNAPCTVEVGHRGAFGDLPVMEYQAAGRMHHITAVHAVHLVKLRDARTAFAVVFIVRVVLIAVDPQREHLVAAVNQQFCHAVNIPPVQRILKKSAIVHQHNNSGATEQTRPFQRLCKFALVVNGLQVVIQPLLQVFIITKDQYEILRKEFRNEAYLLAFDILFWTGCREGEMLALLPKDLTDDDQLRIYKTYHRKKGQDILGPTKNSKKGGNRNVPIPHWLAEEFRTYCSKLYGLTPDDRVFYMTCTALNKELTRCTQITYLPDIRVHDLRHSHVSLCIELGYSIVLVAKRIGDTVPVVMRTYAHLYPNKQQELVSRLETLSTSSSSKDESDLMPLV